MKTVVIIGAGYAGITTAKELRKLDDSLCIKIVTADQGDIYSKPMLSTAFSKKKLATDLVQQSAEFFQQAQRIEMLVNTVVQLIDMDNKNLTTSSGVIPFDSLVLATGSTPRNLSALDHRNVYQLNSLNDYSQLHGKLADAESVAIVGMGLVGCELAHDLSLSDKKVTLVGLGQWPMHSILPPEAGEEFAQSLNELGIEFRYGQAIKEILTDDDKARLVMSSGTELKADVVISAIGVQPNVNLAGESGLEVNHAIVTDLMGLTSSDDVFAIGDCAQAVNDWQPFIAPVLPMAKRIAARIVNVEVNQERIDSPVVVKTPRAPMSYFLPNTIERWEVERREDSTLYTSSRNNKLEGFILIGDQSQRRDLQKKL